ncbi:nitroreductase family protein [Actinoplanes sp. NPDC049548]|uniref:nitroreductase family protein n=1 Tax=Actinoplanes sp. NPDC049548 TaxID=3155152 RepID=UPI00342E14E7
MEFDEVLRRRRMVRTYDPERPVPPEIVDKLVKHALRAPSAGFSQGWGFLVLQEPEDRERYWSVTAAGGPADSWLQRLRTAPLIIVALSNKSVYLDRYAQPDKGWTDRDESRWPVPYWDVDTGFAALLMHLTAVNEGLGSLFFGVPAERIAAFRDAFGIPDEFTPVGALSVGYPAPDKRSPSLRRGHRPVDDVVHHGRWTAGGTTAAR